MVSRPCRPAISESTENEMSVRDNRPTAVCASAFADPERCKVSVLPTVVAATKSSKLECVPSKTAKGTLDGE